MHENSQIKLSPEAEKYVYYREYNPDIIVMLGDCLTIMPLLPKVDLVVTDPPYKQDFAQGGGLMVGKRRETHKQILEDVGSSPEFDISIYIPIILKAAETSLIWCSCRQLPQLFKFVGERFNLLTWVKTNPTPLTNNKMLNDTEFCICLLGDSFSYPDVSFEEKRTAIVMKNGADNLIHHPTVKPINLMKRTIKSFSNGTTSILDPFLGSGTTAVAAKELKRNFIGIEINVKYCEIAKKRLQNTQVPML